MLTDVQYLCDLSKHNLLKTYYGHQHPMATVLAMVWEQQGIHTEKNLTAFMQSSTCICTNCGFKILFCISKIIVWMISEND